jgi:ATP-dependent RNA helicase DDX1
LICFIYHTARIILGRYYFEVTQTDANGITRIGWSVPVAQLDLGTDNQGFGYGGTGKKSFEKQFDDYGETYGINDIIGSLIDLDQMKIQFFKNGELENIYCTK